METSFGKPWKEEKFSNLKKKVYIVGAFGGYKIFLQLSQKTMEKITFI